MMINRRKTFASPNNVMAKFLVDFFMLSTVINGIRGNYYSQNLETKTASIKRIDHLHQLISGNSTIYNENVLVSVGFDKMLNWIFDNEVEKGDRSCAARTLKFKLGDRIKLGDRLKLGERFVGHRKRLQFALLPIMYKMGVMTTLLTGLTVLVLKGLTIGVILLIFAFGNYFTKLHKHSHPQSQPIHVHVHSQDGHNKWTSHPTYSSGPWDREGGEPNPNSYYQDPDFESYRRKFIQPLTWPNHNRPEKT